MTEREAIEWQRERMAWIEARIRVQRRLVSWLVVAAIFQGVSLLIQVASWLRP